MVEGGEDIPMLHLLGAGRPRRKALGRYAERPPALSSGAQSFWLAGHKQADSALQGLFKHASRPAHWAGNTPPLQLKAADSVIRRPAQLSGKALQRAGAESFDIPARPRRRPWELHRGWRAGAAAGRRPAMVDYFDREDLRECLGCVRAGAGRLHSGLAHAPPARRRLAAALARAAGRCYCAPCSGWFAPCCCTTLSGATWTPPSSLSSSCRWSRRSEAGLRRGADGLRLPPQLPRMGGAEYIASAICFWAADS